MQRKCKQRLVLEGKGVLRKLALSVFFCGIRKAGLAPVTPNARCSLCFATCVCRMVAGVERYTISISVCSPKSRFRAASIESCFCLSAACSVLERLPDLIGGIETQYFTAFDFVDPPVQPHLTGFDRFSNNRMTFQMLDLQEYIFFDQRQ